MQSLVALLRAVTVGGTGKLAMDDLVSICEAAGFCTVRTYIASGNAVFKSASGVAETKNILETRLQSFTGRSITVIVRTAGEMAEILAGNPFPDAPGKRVVVIFLDRLTSPADLTGVTGQGADEAIQLGSREIYVHYGSGMARSKLRIPAAEAGTARNMNAVSKLATMAAAG